MIGRRAAALLSIGAAAAMAADYPAEIAAWHKAREAALLAEGGWLSVAGLFWLSEGGTRFGSAKGNAIVLPDGPPKAGQFIVQQERVAAMLGNSNRNLRPGDRLQVGRLTLILMGSPGSYAVRLLDPERPERRQFHGIESYTVREEYRVAAKFVANERRIGLAMSSGQPEDLRSPGYAEFRLQGRDLRLTALLEGPGSKTLWFIFRDQTTGKETYPAGRFLDAEFPRDGQVVLDFNKAYNPPCAFSPYLTCPLPPKDNRLPVRIEAGERTYAQAARGLHR